MILQNDQLDNLLHSFNHNSKICIYSNAEKQMLTDFLDKFKVEYREENCGGGSLAPEMWRIYNPKMD